MRFLPIVKTVFVVLITANSFSQNVGIGTSNPNSSAILDIASASKGLLLPRIADTANIESPAAGLLVYDQISRAPNYYDGNRWNNVADARNNFVPLNGFIKYTVPGAGSIGGMTVAPGPLDAIEYSNASSLPAIQTGAGQLKGEDSLIFTKEFDANSAVFKRAMMGGSVIPSMEIQHYRPGASSPFFTVKLSSVTIKGQSFFISDKTGRLTERYGIMYSVIGFRDLVTGKSFSYNVSSGAFGAY